MTGRDSILRCRERPGDGRILLDHSPGFHIPGGPQTHGILQEEKRPTHNRLAPDIYRIVALEFLQFARHHAFKVVKADGLFFFGQPVGGHECSLVAFALENDGQDALHFVDIV